MEWFILLFKTDQNNLRSSNVLNTVDYQDRSTVSLLCLGHNDTRISCNVKRRLLIVKSNSADSESIVMHEILILSNWTDWFHQKSMLMMDIVRSGTKSNP